MDKIISISFSIYRGLEARFNKSCTEETNMSGDCLFLQYFQSLDYHAFLEGGTVSRWMGLYI